MDSMALNPKTGNLLKIVLVAMFLSAVILIGFNRRTPAAQTTEHPYIAPDDIKSETCLTCHPDKKEGKFVHTAVGMGCENCHQAASEKEKEKTSITLVATGGELCAMCHEASKDPVQHGPYKAGECMVCHEPHSSNFPKQARADTNTLCLSCHGEVRPDVKINNEIQTVSLLGGRSITFKLYDEAPKIPLDRAGKRGHPLMNHPVAGGVGRDKDATVSCLSCHVPHTSKVRKRLVDNPKSEIGLCGACHD